MKFLKVFSELSVSRIAILAVFVTAGYFFLYYDNGSKIEEQITQVNEQVGAEKIKRVEIEKKMKKEEEMRGNLLQLARNLDIVKSKIPNEFNEMEMSAILNRAAAVAQVKLSTLRRNGSVTPIAQKKVIGAELIDEVTFDIEMTGTFHGIITFVEFLSREEKTIRVRNFFLEKLITNLTEETSIRFRGEIVGFKQAVIQKPAVKK